MIGNNTDIGDLFWMMKWKILPIIYAVETETPSDWIFGEYDAMSVTNDTYMPERHFSENPHYLFPWECFDFDASIWISRYDNRRYLGY